MKKNLRRLPLRFIFGLLAAWWMMNSSILLAESIDDETRQLLEKSLSVVEIDKEIARIYERQLLLQSELDERQHALLQKQIDIEQVQAEAGAVLRAYYMGERDILLRALLSFKSLPDLLAMMDYFEWIFARDKDTLNNYKSQYAILKNERDYVHDEQQQLVQIEQNLKQQKSRLLALQSDVDSSLANRSDADRIRLLIEEMTSYWKNIGLYEVKQYFRALADAMKELPAWLNENKQLMSLKGFEYTINVPEQELNEFLRAQNPMFEFFEFKFEEGKIHAHGDREGMQITVSGHYTVENEPKNAIRFHVGELLFNGLRLPDATRDELEREFDLGFYPQLLVSFVKAKSAEINNGELIIKLKLEL